MNPLIKTLEDGFRKLNIPYSIEIENK